MYSSCRDGILLLWTTLMVVIVCGIKNIVGLPMESFSGTSGTSRTSATDDFPPWIQPCGNEVAGSSESRTSIASIIDSLNSQSGCAYRELQILKNKYTAPGPMSRIGDDSDFIGRLDNTSYDRFPQIPTEQEIMDSIEGQMDYMFIEIYGNISAAFVYLEQVKIDESNSENGEFSENFRRLENHVIVLLCGLDTAIKVNLKSSILSYVSRQIMPDYLRHVTSLPKRRQRDYIIVKDSTALMNAIHEQFKRLLFKNMSL